MTQLDQKSQSILKAKYLVLRIKLISVNFHNVMVAEGGAKSLWSAKIKCNHNEVRRN